MLVLEKNVLNELCAPNKKTFEYISTHSSPHIVDMKAENPAAMGLSNSLTLLKMKKIYIYGLV